MTSAVLRAPSYEDRILFLGSTGTGKSQAARMLLGAGYRRWVALDWKGDFNPIGEYRLVEAPPWEDRRAWRADRLLYRPKSSEHRSARSMDSVLRWLFERAQDDYDAKNRRPRAPRIVYVDEALHLGKGRQTAALSDLATAGRSLGIGLWVGSQRPRWIPVEIRSEAFRWLIFFLAYTEDEKEVVRYAKGQLTEEQLQEGWQNHSFWELERLEDSTGRLRVRARHFPPLSLPD